MRYEYLLLCLALSSGSLWPQVAAEKRIVVVRRAAGIPASALTPNPDPKPTAAPFRTSTPLPSHVVVKPTAAPTKTSTSSVSEPPKLAQKPAEQDVAQQPKQATPQLVTGFITKNGNIYEVTDKHGIGMIEARQSPETSTAPHICNYGSVVIYSDVPCDEVTNVHVSDVHHQVLNTAVRDPAPQESQQVSEQSSVAMPQAVVNDNVDKVNATTNANSNNNHQKVDEFTDFDELEGPAATKRKKANKNQKQKKNKRRRNGYKNQSNAVRQGGSKQRRQQAQQQQHRRRLSNNQPKQQRRRQQQQKKQQQQQFKRRGNGQRRRGQNNNRKRYSDDDYYYYK